jgi:outer membrane protein assembly factor BamB
MKKTARIKIFRGFMLIPLVLFYFSWLPSPVLADEGNAWPQFHNNRENTGVSPGSAPDNNHLKWSSTDIGAMPSSSPVIANGKIFVNCENALTCLSESTGTVLWTESINASSVWGSWSSPAYDNGRVFIATDEVYCFSENGGESVWTFPLPNDACNGSVAVSDGCVIAGDWNGSRYYCLDAATGTGKWEFTVDGYAQGTPAVVDGRVYLTSWANVSGNVYCLDIINGIQVWHTRWLAGDDLPDWDTCGSPCVAEDKIFITTYNFYGYGELLALNTSDGSFAWDDTDGGRVRQIERTDATPAYYDGKIYLCGGCFNYSDEGERTYCFDASDGSLVWQTDVDDLKENPDIGNWTCSPALADGKVFVGKPESSSNYFDYSGIYALDASDGSVIWSYEHGGASPAVCNGVVFTVDDGKVWAFGPASTTYLAWDINRDGYVNNLDLICVVTHFGESGADGWIPEDINRDGYVNGFDLILLGNYYTK